MAEASQLKKLLKEPLIHFLGGALLVFAFFWATGANQDPEDYRIEISEADISRLQAGWIQNFRRPPTNEELDALIEQQVTEEIYYREGLRLGLDRDDAVIRRRLFTKMRFLDAEDSEGLEPTDAELREWMDANPGKYARASRYTLAQVYLGQTAGDDVDEQLAGLNAGTIAPADIARPISLPDRLEASGRSDIARQFGERFAQGLDALETGTWTGPVQSGFGFHLVKIETRSASEDPPLEDVRQQVTNDWRAARNIARNDEALARYRVQYEISIAGRE